MSAPQDALDQTHSTEKYPTPPTGPPPRATIQPSHHWTTPTTNSQAYLRITITKHPQSAHDVNNKKKQARQRINS